MRFPQAGTSWDNLENELNRLSDRDSDWRSGRVPLYVFHANDAVAEVGRRAFMRFFSENALGARRAFDSLKTMESEVVSMALDLFNGPDGASGHMTSGGSESIFLAVKAARERHRARQNGPAKTTNLVLPYSAHPAFDKAARVMDIEVRRVALRPDLKADSAAMAEAVDEQTVMLVGSAPCFPHGVFDPIAELDCIAQAHDLWLHVDACVGGYIAPFAREAGRAIPEFDFALGGVTSISADLHKFGFVPKPASTVFFRRQEDMDRNAFGFDDWPSGRYETNTLVGTRPGGAIAAAWAVMRFLGRDGYKRIADDLMTMVDGYVDGIKAIKGLYFHAEPMLTIINFGWHEGDIFAVAECMSNRGWVPGLTRDPRGMHAMMSMLHEGARDDFLSDLSDSIAKARRGSGASKIQTVY